MSAEPTPGTRPDGELLLPGLDGRHVFLRAVGPEDYGYLQLMETSSEMAARWKYRGATPSPEQWAQGLWNGTLAQFLIISRADETPVGIVSAFQPSFQDGHAHVAAAKFDLRRRSPLMMLGFAMFVEYVFACWDLHKLYLELPEYNYEQFASGEGRYFEIEGRRRDHFFLARRRWDQILLAIFRDEWLRYGSPIARAEALDA